jgi:hypothetical protein
MVDEPIDRPNKILLMDPRYVLTTVTTSSTETTANQSKQYVEGSISVKTHDDGRAHFDDTGIWHVYLINCLFPRRCNINAKSPRIWNIRFQTTDDTCELIIRGIVAMRVDCCGTGLQPNTGWVLIIRRFWGV